MPTKSYNRRFRASRASFQGSWSTLALQDPAILSQPIFWVRTCCWSEIHSGDQIIDTQAPLRLRFSMLIFFFITMLPLCIYVLKTVASLYLIYSLFISFVMLMEAQSYLSIQKSIIQPQLQRICTNESGLQVGLEFMLRTSPELDQGGVYTGKRSSKIPLTLRFCFLSSSGMPCTRGMKPLRICTHTFATWWASFVLHRRLEYKHKRSH